MQHPSLLIAGCGDVGNRLASQLHACQWIVHGLRRDVSRLSVAALPVPGDLAQHDCPAAWPVQLDYLVFCAAPGRGDEAGYRATYVAGLQQVLAWLASRGQRPRRLLFVSSTGVYGQSDGEWVDEQSPALADSFSGQILREAEQLAGRSGLPATCVRLAGIYGPGRHWLLNQVRQGYRAPSQPVLYGNRIHADDAAGLLAFLLQADWRGLPLADCYLGVDDQPAPLHEVVDWLRAQLQVSTQLPAGLMRRAGNKRCSNQRLRALGWQPRYPSYREGYTALLQDA